MKIDKTKPAHWLYLSQFGFVTLLAAALRLCNTKKAKQKSVVLYGHKFNSNLKSIYDYSKTVKATPVKIYFLTMDPVYYKELIAQGVDALLATQLTTALLLAKTNCIISNYFPLKQLKPTVSKFNSLCKFSQRR